jgi:hypothetical protein
MDDHIANALATESSSRRFDYLPAGMVSKQPAIMQRGEPYEIMYFPSGKLGYETFEHIWRVYDLYPGLLIEDGNSFLLRFKVRDPIMYMHYLSYTGIVIPNDPRIPENPIFSINLKELTGIHFRDGYCGTSLQGYPNHELTSLGLQNNTNFCLKKDTYCTTWNTGPKIVLELEQYLRNKGNSSSKYTG